MNTKHRETQFWILMILMVILGLSPALGFAAEVWTPKADMPTPRHHLSCSVVDGKIYAISGRLRGGSGRVPTVEAYDPATNQWTTKASIPTGRTDFFSCAVDGKIYAMGGNVGGGVGAGAVVEAYDPATDTWTRKADMPHRRAGVGCAVVNGKIYLIGGNTGSSLVEIYDPSMDRWTRGTDIPTPRHPGISVVDGKIYAIGGLGVAPNWPALSVVEEYDPATDTWTTKTDMPTPRYGLATAVVDGRIYAISGYRNDVDILDSVEVYDPATDSWTEAPSLRIARDGSCAAVVDETIYVMGGIHWGSGLPVFDSVEAFRPVRASNARNAEPAGGTTDVYFKPVLEWTAGAFAQQHDVYFGTDFTSVNDAGNTGPAGPDSVYRGRQDGNSYAVPETLNFEQPYYWRIDEVNGPPDDTVFIGNVWSFTTEPYSIPVANVSATASSSFGLSAAENTVNGSGLVDDLHGTNAGDMWISGGVPATIEYAFDRAYKLHELWIWNSNQLIESFVGFGAKDVVIEHSLDGEIWAVLEGVGPLARGLAAEGYAHNNTIDLGGAVAQYVRLTINSVQGIAPQASLSEVRFFYLPTYPTQPQPADGEVTDSVDVTLQWRPGREAVSHEILLSMDPAAVQDGSALVAIANENTYAPDPLIYGTTYTWQVNEIYEAEEYSSYLGDPWTFTTPEYAVIDNFDQYDNDCERIFFTWLDGWGHNGAADCGIAPFAGNGTGAVVGNLDAPFAEKRIVKSGSALSLTYDNSMSPFYSEVESAAFALPSDWTPGAAQTLSLSFRGRPVAFRENTDGSITMSGMGAGIADTTDEGHFAYRELTGDGTITVRLDSLQDVRDSTKAGVMIRETLFPWSKNVYLSGTPRNLTQFQYRGATAGNTVEIASSENATPLPVWLRLTRAGRVFTAQRSQDGVNWESITTDQAASRRTVTMSNPLYVGLAVTSHDIEIPAVAEFSHVSFSGQVSDRWQLEAMTVEQVSNDPESIYLGIADDRGGIAVITHPDPAATQIATWTEWRIPMSHFVAVDLSNVQKVFLGVGDRDNPTSGGKGKLYIEDIRIGTPLPLAEDAYPSLE